MVFPRRYRRSSQRRLLRAVLYLAAALLVFDLLTVLKHYRQFSHNLLAHAYADVASLPSPVQNQKIYICAQFWTNALVVQERWGQALLDLIGILGKENIYVSIHESGSLDNTKEVLKVLDAALEANGIPRTISMDPTTHADYINQGPLDAQGQPRSGWIQTTTVGAGKEMRRIPYLATIRNKSLQPLWDLHDKGQNFDKILFLNDVVFRPADVLALLATNQGSFAAACAMDYRFPPSYYDTFALRDSDGDGTVMQSFPYFRSPASRDALLQGRAARVQSCWNGMIAMDASAFYEGLRFRALSDSLASMHLEASECCLIHTDMKAMNMASQGVYVNPSVRVGYTVDAYNLTHVGSEQTFVSATQYVRGVWINRLRRTLLSRVTPGMKVVAKRLQRWQKEAENSLEKRVENGQICTIDEQHILVWNGWKHV